MPQAMIRHITQASMMALALLAAPALAQSGSIDTLAGYLRTLSSNPRDLSALLGAGRAALDAGDPNAALGFFSRATQVDARNGRAKAGLASSLVMLERPDEALKFFNEAQQLGVDEDDIAKDRGLAYDLRGDNRLAQRDYALALRKGPDAEITRRMALSYGIAGDQRSAMALLDPLMRRNDQAAWRARAFVMAMTGNLDDANAVARGVMPGSLAASMAPFLQQLGRLNAAERAHAVNFGTMPAGGRRTQVALGDPYRGVASPPPVQVASNDVPAAATASGRRRNEPSSRAGRRRPGQDVQVAVNTPVRQPEPQYIPPPERREPVFAPANSVVQPVPQPRSEAPANVAALVPEAKPAPPRKQALPLAPGGRLSGLLAGLTMEQETAPVSLDPAKQRAAKAAARKKADAEAKAKAEAAAKAKELAEEKARIKKNPSRVWVQIASGPNESALPFTWNKMRKEHDDLDGKSAWSMPYGRTNRLLVGPMKSQAEAKALVAKLGKDGLRTNVFLSEAGQEIEKLGGK